MAAFLEVTAQLEITLADSTIADSTIGGSTTDGSTIAGSTMRVRGNGSRLEVDVPNLRTALLIKRQFESTLNRIDSLLRASGLALDLRLQSSEIGRLGYGAEPTFMGRLAGCSNMELRMFPLLWAVSKSFFGSNETGKRT